MKGIKEGIMKCFKVVALFLCVIIATPLLAKAEMVYVNGVIQQTPEEALKPIIDQLNAQSEIRRQLIQQWEASNQETARLQERLESIINPVIPAVSDDVTVE